MIVALAATACVAAGSGGYFLLAGSSSSDKSAAPPVVHHVPVHHSTSSAATAAQQAAATQALLSRSMTAMRAKGSFETVETYADKGESGHSTNWTGLTTASSTTEVDGVGQAQLRVVGPAAYVVGDSAVLQRDAHMDADAADLLGDKWLELAKGDTGYDDVMAYATLADDWSKDWFSGPVTQLPTTTVNGQRVIPLRGAPAKDAHAGPHASAVLYLAADGDPLPVKYEMTSDTDHEAAVFNNWGTQQTVLAPPVAIDKAWLENAAAAEAANPCGCESRSSIT